VVRKLLRKCEEVFDGQICHRNHFVGGDLGVKQFPADAQNASITARAFFDLDVHVFFGDRICKLPLTLGFFSSGEWRV